MSLNNISKDILLKAEVKKDNLYSQLDTNKNALEDEFESDLKSFKDLEYSKHKSNLDLNSQKVLSFYKKESRKIVLFAKSKVIEDLLDETLIELKSLKNKEKIELFERLIKRAEDIIDFERIICNNSDVKLVRGIVKNIEGLKKVKVSPVDTLNGLIFESCAGKQILDMTYENLFTEILTDNEDKLQKKLFNI